MVDITNNSLQSLFWLGAAHGAEVHAVTESELLIWYHIGTSPFSRSLMSLLLIRFFSPVDVLGFGISIFLSENGALENVSFSALFIDFTREKICAGL